MKGTKKIAIIGGTGKTGKYLVHQLIHQGFHCHLLIRHPERLLQAPDLVNICTGDASNYTAVREVIDGCQAVISTLGLGIPPSEPTIFSKATSHILRAMQECHVQRYIVTTGLNVDTPLDNKGPATKAATQWMYANYPVSTADRQTEYSLLTASSAEWTLVRLPLIEQTTESYPVNISLYDCPGEKISATDLALFLINQFSDSTYSRQAPFIANI